MIAARVLLLTLVLLDAAAARADIVQESRKVPTAALDVAVERHVLANGLVVLLAPDPTASSVAVWLTFRAGAAHVPAGRSGLAHLLEHVVATGRTPATDYAGMADARRARYFNASTSADDLAFECVLPPEELPFALWMQADRLRRIPELVTPEEVERSRRIVLEERALGVVDRPYGLVDEQVSRRLYGARHPLERGVLGAPEELGRLTAAELLTFAAGHLVPANGVLVVAGRFDPATALRLANDGLGRLPAGVRAVPPRFSPAPQEGSVDQRAEPLSREPRVSLAWRFQDVPPDQADALRVGAIMLTFLTDGAWGMRLSAGLEEHEGESTFLVNLTVPYEEPSRVVHDDAAGFLRMLTHKEIPLELQIAGNLSLDRSSMFALDSVAERAQLLSRLELWRGAGDRVGATLARRWDLEGGVVRDVARQYLRRPPQVVHARPTRPRPARAERE
ncbi:MAG: pitrilysin family protein [Anaeromyxobacteraceae bacterium]